MSSSDWGSDSSASESAESGTCDVNRHLVELVATRPPPRVTQRRRQRSRSSSPTPSASGLSAEAAGSGRTADAPPRQQARIDLPGLLRHALAQSSAECPSTDVDEVVRRVVLALRRSEDGAGMARAVTRALADPLNAQLRVDVLTGVVSPDELAALDEVRLMNPTARGEMERARTERLNQQSVEYLERLSLTVTHMFTCPACGSRECYANFRSTDFVKWQGDDATPTLLRCCKCALSFRQ
ncbi:transcription elongation factor-like protein [Novymonas esmeraldas]|uniref:Transcription elongation factor-like protein n=1 Tax=Novymonas esmeraldas TaxID=1808958 RepID=A0AAW0EP09_9TRYP